MRVNIFFFTAAAGRTALRIDAALRASGRETTLYTVGKVASENAGFMEIRPSLKEVTGRLFRAGEGLVFIGAAGIAVRSIAPFIKGKDEDPPVLVIDEKGNFVVPILAGHIGGANALARHLAKALRAVPVLTTATDVNGLFAVDEWAVKKGFTLSSLQDAKAFAAALLDEGRAGVSTDFIMDGPLPPGLEIKEKGPVGMAVTAFADKCPFDVTVRVYPPVLHIGVGCRRGKGRARIRKAVEAALNEAGLAPEAIKDFNTIDIKADEAGLLEAAESFGVPLRLYSAERLREVNGNFTTSDFVRQNVGVDNVCERAALAGAVTGKLIVRKYIRDGVTVAVAVDGASLSWE